MDYSCLNYDILIHLGLQTTQDNLIIDQDNYNLLQMNGKTIKYNVPDEQIDKRSEIQFCPAKSLVQARYLLGYYLDKLLEEQGLNCILQYSTSDFITHSNYTLLLKFSNREDLCSETFINNEALCFIDLIFKLDGINYDLKQYDIRVK